jgi:F0F1-type ATP synthase membrane subunit b/b'
MQAQAEMNAEALVRAARRERERSNNDVEAEIRAKLDEMRAQIDRWAREDAEALKSRGVDRQTP